MSMYQAHTIYNAAGNFPIYPPPKGVQLVKSTLIPSEHLLVRTAPIVEPRPGFPELRHEVLTGELAGAVYEALRGSPSSEPKNIAVPDSFINWAKAVQEVNHPSDEGMRKFLSITRQELEKAFVKGYGVWPAQLEDVTYNSLEQTLVLTYVDRDAPTGFPELTQGILTGEEAERAYGQLKESDRVILTLFANTVLAPRYAAWSRKVHEANNPPEEIADLVSVTREALDVEYILVPIEVAPDRLITRAGIDVVVHNPPN